jgi:Spx/MgsR family transcriptional regulator
MIVVYGIPNCDTVKKARAWLDEQGVAYRFHDLKVAGVPTERLDTWVAHCGWERLVNRHGTTWRKLGPCLQVRLTDASSAKRLMQSHPSIVKRPVVDWGDQVTVGFDPAAWALLARR